MWYNIFYSAGAANEGQFAFTSEKVGMPQKLRATLTYMIQVLSNLHCRYLIQIPRLSQQQLN